MVNKEKKIDCTCCQYEFLCLEKKRVTRLTIGMITITFMIFCGGYYLGKRKAAQELLDIAQQEYLIMQSPLTTALNNYNQAVEQRKKISELSQESVEGTVNISKSSQEQPSQDSINQNWYQAQLAGFGSYKGALQCVQRLKKSGMNTNIVKRVSKSACKTIYWYQVVSDKYIDKKELEDMLAEIARKEKLNDVKIVKVNHDSNERALT